MSSMGCESKIFHLSAADARTKKNHQMRTSSLMYLAVRINMVTFFSNIKLFLAGKKTECFKISIQTFCSY